MESTVISNPEKITSLLKREAERQLDLQQKRNEKKLLNPEHEQFTYFTQIFQEKLNELETLLDLATNVEQKDITSYFDKIWNEVQTLQKFVGDSVIFLRGYDIRICQESLQDFETKARKLEDKLLPKKKFGFKNKRTAKKIDEEIVKKNGHDEIDNIKKSIKLDEIFFGFKNQSSAVLNLNGDSLFKKDISLQNLEKCIVKLNGAPNTLHMNALQNCIIFCGPVSTSIFVENCKNCKLVIACQQLRLHSSTKCDIYLHVTSRAIIEDCNNINVAPYNYMYDSLVEDFNKAGLDQRINHWNDIDDFNWLVVDKQSPNWSVLDDSCKIKNWESYNASDEIFNKHYNM